MDARELMDLVVSRAQALRNAGVRSLKFDGVELELEPRDPPTIDLSTSAPEEYSDPLMDPSTYPGGVVPSFDLSEES